MNNLSNTDVLLNKIYIVQQRSKAKLELVTLAKAKDRLGVCL